MKKHGRTQSYEQLQSEIRNLKSDLKRAKSRCFWDNISKLVQPLVKWGVFAFLGYCVYLSIHDLSGKHTDALINFKAEASLNPDEPSWPYWIAALSAIIATASISYGLSERKLRKSTVEQLAPYKEKWEQSIDPKRTSSELLPDGATNPRDE
jgi:hypothetical protein